MNSMKSRATTTNVLTSGLSCHYSNGGLMLKYLAVATMLLVISPAEARRHHGWHHHHHHTRSNDGDTIPIPRPRPVQAFTTAQEPFQYRLDMPSIMYEPKRWWVDFPSPPPSKPKEVGIAEKYHTFAIVLFLLGGIIGAVGAYFIPV